MRCSPGLSRYKVLQLCTVVMLAWASTLELQARLGELLGVVWEKHRLIEHVCQGPLFTGEAKHWGQTPGEMFLLDRSGETVLLSPSAAPSSSLHYTKPPQTPQMLMSRRLKDTFPIQAPHCFYCSSFTVFITLCGFLLHWSCSLCRLSLPLSLLKLNCANDTMLFISLKQLQLLFFF